MPGALAPLAPAGNPPWRYRNIARIGTRPQAFIVPGKSCGSRTKCCTVMGISELEASMENIYVAWPVENLFRAAAELPELHLRLAFGSLYGTGFEA